MILPGTGWAAGKTAEPAVGTLGPGGAKGCSHGWSGGAAQPAAAQPVEAGSCLSRPGRGEGFRRASAEHSSALWGRIRKHRASTGCAPLHP